MVYLPTFGWFFSGKCWDIFHTWSIWDNYSIQIVELVKHGDFHLPKNIRIRIALRQSERIET